MTQTNLWQKIESLLVKIWHWQYFPIILLAFATFFAHYFFFQDFGIHEDDVAFVATPNALHNPFAQLPRIIWQDLTTFFQGRPIGFMIPHIIAIFFGKLGGLPAVYIGGFLIVWLNASLMFLLVLKLTDIRWLAFLAATIFSMYPADTTHVLLTHNLSLQYALTWLLLAFHADLAGKKWLAYIFAALILLTYETPYWVFLSSPLFFAAARVKIRNTLQKEMIKRFLIMMVIMIIYSIVRVILEEQRVVLTLQDSFESVPSLSIPMRILIAWFVGPFTSLSTFLLSVVNTFQRMTPVVLSGILISFVVYYFLLGVFKMDAKSEDLQQNTMQLDKPLLSARFDSTPEAVRCVRLLLVCIPAFSFAYMLSFTHFPANITTGRMSAVHMASAFPGAILVSIILYLGVLLLKQINKKQLGLFLVALMLSLIFGYRLTIQEDFKMSWLKTRRMTTQVIDLIQDIGPETVVFINTKGLEETRYIGTYTNQFVVHEMLQIIYYLAPDFNPRLILIYYDYMANMFVYKDGQYYYDYDLRRTPEPYLITDGDIIRISWDGERFVREYGTIQILDAVYTLKPQGAPTLSQFVKTPVFDWFYQPDLLELEGPLEFKSLWD